MKKLITLLTILFITTLSFAQYYDTLRFKATNGVGQEVSLKFTISKEDRKLVKNNKDVLKFVVVSGINDFKYNLKNEASFEFISKTIGQILVYKEDDNDSIMNVNIHFFYKAQNGYGNYLYRKGCIMYHYNIYTNETYYIIKDETFLNFYDW